MQSPTTRKIAHNTIVQIVGKIISTALGLLALGMMTRYLGQEKFGWYITAISFLQFAGIIIDFGLIPVTAQMLSEPNTDKTKLIQNLLGFRLLTATVCFVLVPGIALFFPYPPEVKAAIALSAISFIGISLNQILTGFYQTELKMHISALADLVGRIVLVVGMWLLIYKQASFLPIIILIVISNLSQTAYLWAQAIDLTKIGFKFDWLEWKKIITKMWPIAISIIFNVVYLRGDVILLSIYKSQNEVGLYGSAYRVLDIISQLGMLMMGVMLPLMAAAWSRGLREEFTKWYQQSFDMLMFFAIPVTAGTVLLSEKIMMLVGGTEFSSASIILQLLSLAVFGVYLGAVFGHTAVALNKQKQTMWIYLSDAILTLIGYILFIPRYGATGAAWMSVFSELYAGILLFITISHFSKVKLRLNNFAKIILSSFIMSIVILQIKNYPLFTIVPIGVIIYATILITTKGISLSTIKEIISIKKV
jgi:O-antigen/teichoic acid export membrane protein